MYDDPFVSSWMFQSFSNWYNKESVFANKIVLLSDDFRQTLPVVEHGNKTDVLRHCLKLNWIYDQSTKFKLTTNLRILRFHSNEIYFR